MNNKARKHNKKYRKQLVIFLKFSFPSAFCTLYIIYSFELYINIFILILPSKKTNCENFFPIIIIINKLISQNKEKLRRLNTIETTKEKEKVTAEFLFHSEQNFQYISHRYFKLTQS